MCLIPESHNQNLVEVLAFNFLGQNHDGEGGRACVPLPK